MDPRTMKESGDLVAVAPVNLQHCRKTLERARDYKSLKKKWANLFN